jgi:signal peptidase II
MRWMFGLVALDWLVKRLALAWIPPLVYGSYPYGGIPIFEWGGISFSLNFVVNTGAAWGLFAGHAGLLFAIRLAIIVGVIGWVKKSWPIWLILAGALGNGLDYCQYGHVIDFFHFNFWGYSFPIFNVADACISIGALSLFLFPKKVGQPQAL